MVGSPVIRGEENFMYYQTSVDSISQHRNCLTMRIFIYLNGINCIFYESQDKNLMRCDLNEPSLLYARVEHEFCKLKVEADIQKCGLAY